MLKVEQADRVLASQIVISTENAKRILAGENDDHPWVRKVAQYREDTALPLREVLDSVTYALIGLHVATGKKSDTADKAISQAMALLHPDTKGGE